MIVYIVTFLLVYVLVRIIVSVALFGVRVLAFLFSFLFGRKNR